MHGVIHNCIQLLFENYDKNKWDEFLEIANANKNEDFLMFQMYDDERTVHLLVKVGQCLGITLEETLFLYGQCFYHYLKRLGFSTMLHSLGRDFESFLRNLDFHHYFISTFVYESVKAPSFRVDHIDDSHLLLFYYSKRKLLHHLVIGMASECAKEIFGLTISMEVLSISEDIIWGCKMNCVKMMITMTTSIEGSFQLPEHLQARQSLVPIVKQNYSMSSRDLQLVFPFHVVFDNQLIVIGLGRMLVNRMKGNDWIGVPLAEIAKIIHPAMDWDVNQILNYRHAQFVIEFATNIDNPLLLTGEMYKCQDDITIIFLASPKAKNLEELRANGLFLSDLAIHDVSRQLILLNQQRLVEVNLSKELETTTAQLKRVSAELESERKKTDALLYEILPRQVADSLKNGNPVEARHFKSVSILFTDIVNFTDLSAKCHAIDIVKLLNELFSKFDEVVHAMDVYKVETIGDAYMVAGGVPTTTNDHSIKVAKTALCLRAIAPTVPAPGSNNYIQIRGGIHTGPVMAGVVGKTMPRYCLFGDSVNTASRMESHGVPGEIQISEAVYLVLKSEPFEITFRAKLEIKGKGRMKTYLLKGLSNFNLKEFIDQESVNRLSLIY